MTHFAERGKWIVIYFYPVSCAKSRSVHYFAFRHQVTRHDPVRRFELLALYPPDKQTLLPILSDSPLAAAASPLAQYARPEPATNFPTLASTEALLQPSEIAAHLLNPNGPWRLSFDLRVPDCLAAIHVTNKRPGGRIIVNHCLKVGLRVSRNSSPGKKPKMFDIMIEIPVNIISVCDDQSFLERDFVVLKNYSFSCGSVNVKPNSHTFLRILQRPEQRGTSLALGIIIITCNGVRHRLPL